MKLTKDQVAIVRRSLDASLRNAENNLTTARVRNPMDQDEVDFYSQLVGEYTALLPLFTPKAKIEIGDAGEEDANETP